MRPKTYNLFKTKIEIGCATLVVDSAARELWQMHWVWSQETWVAVPKQFSVVWSWAGQVMDTVCSFFTCKMGDFFFLIQRYTWGLNEPTWNCFENGKVWNEYGCYHFQNSNYYTSLVLKITYVTSDPGWRLGYYFKHHDGCRSWKTPISKVFAYFSFYSRERTSHLPLRQAVTFLWKKEKSNKMKNIARAIYYVN